MSAEAGVLVTFAEGVRDDVASLIANASGEAGASELKALKNRIAELLVECKANSVNSRALVGILSWPTADESGSTSPPTKASRASVSSTATSHPTAPPPSAAGSPSRPVPGCGHIAKHANARDDHPNLRRNLRR